MLNQWSKESLLKLKEIIREQQAKQNARDMADREREKQRMRGSNTPNP